MSEGPAHEDPRVELSLAELLLVKNANEVCNGIHLDDSEFATRLGAL